ncbi:MAG: NTP transferase domain-containing protein, partial [Gemmatimonadetes bacterium]|nr:NTP transferase domain-containing protein [Gemmatimonadota bacterium]
MVGSGSGRNALRLAREVPLRRGVLQRIVGRRHAAPLPAPRHGNRMGEPRGRRGAGHLRDQGFRRRRDSGQNRPPRLGPANPHRGRVPHARAADRLLPGLRADPVGPGRIPLGAGVPGARRRRRAYRVDRVRPRGAGPGTGRDANRVERLRDRCGLPAGVGGGRAGGRVCAGLGVVAQCRLTLYHDCVTPPPLTLVILAAGRSTRFGRLKQLTPIGPGGEALLDYALYDGALAGFSRFLLVIQEDLQADFDAHLRP